MITNIDTLTMLQKVYNSMSEDDRQTADKVICGEYYRSEPYKTKEAKYQELGIMTTFTPMLVGEMIRALKQDISQSESGKSRSSGKRTVLNSMMKAAAKENRQEWTKTTLIQNGKQYYCNGYVGFVFTEIDENLPVCPDNYKDKYFDLEKKVLEPARANITAELELPSYKLLEMYYKQNKKKYSKPQFTFGDNQPTVNPEYLLQVMKVLPGIRLYMTDKLFTPIYGIDENGNEAILMPIRANENEPAGRTQL